jgi:hypothetical protein
MKRCETHFLSDIEIWITPKIKQTPIAVISLELPTLQHQSLQQLTQFNLQTRVGFGSCHSFGVAGLPIVIGMCGYGMCQMCGGSPSTVFLKIPRCLRGKFRVGCIGF